MIGLLDTTDVVLSVQLQQQQSVRVATDKPVTDSDHDTLSGFLMIRYVCLSADMSRTVVLGSSRSDGEGEHS